MGHARWLVWFVFLGGCASTPTRSDDAASDACRGLATATRRAIESARAGQPDAPAADVVMAALAPYGRCVGAATAAGQWAFTLGDLELEGAAVEDGPRPWLVRVYNAQPRFVTRGGVVATDAVDLPPIDRYIDQAGRPAEAPYPHLDAIVTLELGVDWSNDGVPEALVQGLGALVPLHFDGRAVVSYPPAAVLPAPTHTLDLDGDGRGDLGDDSFFYFNLAGDGLFAEPLTLVARAVADGTFTTDDAVTRAHYQKACAGLGSSPWMFGRPDDESLVNMACAMVAGVPGAQIADAVDAESALIDDAYLERDDHNTILVLTPRAVREWLEREVPITVTRADGRRVLAATATASASEAPLKGYRFDAAQAVDGDLGTFWQPMKGGTPWLELRFGKPERVSALEIGNGFQRVDALGDLFLMNRRATRVTVTIGGREHTLPLDPSTAATSSWCCPSPSRATGCGSRSAPASPARAGRTWPCPRCARSPRHDRLRCRAGDHARGDDRLRARRLTPRAGRRERAAATRLGLEAREARLLEARAAHDAGVDDDAAERARRSTKPTRQWPRPQVVLVEAGERMRRADHAGRREGARGTA